MTTVTPPAVDVDIHPSAWRSLAAFVRRDFTTAASYRVPFALDIGSGILQVALFFFLSSVVNESNAEFLRAFDGGYFAYVVVGLVVMRTIDTTIRGFAAALRNEQVAGTFEALVTAPPPLRVLVIGGAMYNVMYGMAVGWMMLGFAAVLGVDFNLTASSLVAALVAYLACIVIFSAVGMAVAAFVIVFKQGNSVLGLITQGLALLAGVYFPVRLLPPILQQIGDLVPLTWALEAVRAGLLRGTVEVVELVALAAAALVTPVVASLLLTLAVRRAKRAGSLAQY